MSKLVSAPAVHTANAARGKEPDAGQCRHDHGRGHRGGAGAAFGDCNGQVAPAELGHGRAAAAQRFDLRLRQAGLQPPVNHRHGGRHGAVAQHLGLHAQRGLDVLRPGHAVRDDGGFQRHHGRAAAQRGGHVGVQVEVGVGLSLHRPRVPQSSADARASAPVPGSDPLGPPRRLVAAAVAHAQRAVDRGDGFPGWHLLAVFVLGTVLMRSAGCCINDVADRHFDRHVKRTARRPVTRGAIGVAEALAVGAVLACWPSCWC
jgi:hypothetical protein